MKIRRFLAIGIVLVLLLAAGAFVWARSVLGSDQVRRAIEGQLTRALGQPVTVASVSAGIFPRVTLTLNDVRIGDAGKVTARQLHVGTDFRALLSRRIERGAIRLDGARLELPLPPFAFMRGETSASPSSGAPVELVSIDAVEITDATIVSGGRTLRANIDVVPEGAGLRVRRVTLEAGGTSLEMSGAITDILGPRGELNVKARELNVLDLHAFVSDFVAGIEIGERGSAGAAAAPMELVVNVDAARAILGTLLLDAFTGRARVTNSAVQLDPLSFRVFGGTSSGALSLSLADTPAYQLRANVSGIDMAQVMRFAGSGDTITGKLSGTVDVSGVGVDARRALETMRGAADLDVRDGTVAGLQIVRTVVLAGSMRADSRDAAAAARGAGPEPFSSLTARFAVTNGVANTSNLKFQSPDVLLAAAGSIVLSTQRTDLAGDVQLSEALTKQAGRDLVRYTQDDGRVTLPITVEGTPGDFAVRIDVAAAGKRAIANRAQEEAKKAIGNAIKRIIKREH